MRSFGLLCFALALGFAAACITHRALWGFVFRPPVAILSACESSWLANTVRGQSVEAGISRLPAEFDGVLARLRPGVDVVQADAAEFAARLERSELRVCAVFRCIAPARVGVACLVPTSSGSDRYQMAEATYDPNGSRLGPVVSWHSEVAGLEFLTLPFLVVVYCIAALLGLGVFLARRASSLPK